MSANKKTNSTLLSTAAAALLLSAPVTVSAQDNLVGKCWGANSCKGLGSCKSSVNACKGQNSCSGEGYLIMSLEACSEYGGDFTIDEDDSSTEE